MLDPIKPQTSVPRDLALRMIPTIHRIARQLAQRLPRHIRVDDLVGAGCQGLVSALARFDPARGEGFESYAEFRIRGAMLDELRACDPLSRDQRAHANRIAVATRALHARLGRAPDADEVAKELGISLDTYWERLSAASTGVVSSLDGDEDRNSVAQLPDPSTESADDHLIRKQLKQAINRAIASLPARLQRVLELHYGEGLTLRQIGELLGVSESRVCQLQSEAVRRIRELCQDHLGNGAPEPRSIAQAARRSPAPPAAIAA
jgi:RNA polymerase sigma factor for flagellar operon FliA